MFCKSCGAIVKDGEKFCSKCGTPVGGDEDKTQKLKNNDRMQNGGGETYNREKYYDSRKQFNTDSVHQPVYEPEKKKSYAFLLVSHEK